MLGKLMKYEFKACGRIFFPLYIGILFLSAANGVSIGSSLKDQEGYILNSNALNTQSILTLVMFALFVALFVITIILIIQRFKKNLLEDEGYLMFTLPVKTSSLVLSKLLVALIYAIISAIVSSLSFLIIGMIGGDFNIAEFFKLISEVDILRKSMELMVYMILWFLISYIIFVLSIYLSLSIGQLPQLIKYKMPAGVVLFFIINLIISKIQTFMRNSTLGSVPEIDLTNNMTNLPYRYLFISSIISIIIGTILFFLTNWILNKELNLE